MNEMVRGWGGFAVLIFAVLILAGYRPTVEQTELQRPTPEGAVVAFLVLTVVSVWSWRSCGSDHEENVDEDHPDGRLTYPGDPPDG